MMPESELVMMEAAPTMFEPVRWERFGRAENDLLICCARTQLSEEMAERIRRLACGEINWDYLFKAAFQHRLLPLVYHHLCEISSEAIPEAIHGKFRVYSHMLVAHILFNTNELVRVLQLLETHGIPAIALKGPTLGTIAYGNVVLRTFGDLDILVQKKDISRCADLLIEQGYKCRGIKEEIDEGLALALERDGVVVELHWTLVHEIFSFAPNLDALWDRAIHVPFTGSEVRVLAPEDLFLYLCAHGSKHHWRRISWICDLAEMIRAQPQMNWDIIIERARKLGSERMLYLGLQLAYDLLNASLPEQVIRISYNDPVVRQLAAKVTLRMFREEPLDSQYDLFKFHVERFAFHLKMRERMRDRMVYYFSLPRRCFLLARTAFRRIMGDE